MIRDAARIWETSIFAVCEIARWKVLYTRRKPPNHLPRGRSLQCLSGGWR